MATRTEAEWMGVLDAEAKTLYLAWRKIGHTPQQALNEVSRAGLLDTSDGTTPVVMRTHRRSQ